eukprot:CAMPEP_0173077260 /NCGR_PEP_ID=MMETSP1102-20130122/13079_1 /TAXON_ID=49646 /ORGANISM="Geminigera sp., Strain Caron Lab Isolate" /LENGTH=435 /DNA_ID=CAMNT_0013947631 /DNA_START=106 /DNA_END=1413 /DNA_ORIENTATION=+
MHTLFAEVKFQVALWAVAIICAIEAATGADTSETRLCTAAGSGECPGNQPICSLFLTDVSSRERADITVESLQVGSRASAAISRRGICVECEDDCDCGVNQYCGIDHDYPKTIPSGMQISAKGMPVLQSHFDKISAAVAGMAIKSKCLEYEIQGKSCSRMYDASSNIPRVYEGADEYQKLSHRFKLIDHDPKTYQQIGVQESFCGKINSWAPKTRTWAGSADFGAEGMEAASTGNLRDFPASCTKQVKMEIPGADECKYKGEYFTVPISSCDELEYTSGSGRETCKVACTPASSGFSSLDCSIDSLSSDEASFCKCVQTCNICVKSSQGCNADESDSNGHCGECDDSVSPPPPPSSPFTCAMASQESIESETSKMPVCKSACRDCMAIARKTACLCQDKTGTRTSVYFGDCLTDGRFSYKLEKKPGDLETSKSFK